MPTPLALVVVNIICIFVCYQIAKERKGDARFWGWMGVLFGPLAVPFVFFARPQEK